MSTYTIDSDKLKEVGEEIKSISLDYNNIINDFYSKINDVTKNGTWASDSEGGAANQFVEIVNKNKETIQLLSSSLKSLGDKVVDYANKVNNCSDNKL